MMSETIWIVTNRVPKYDGKAIKSFGETWSFDGVNDLRFGYVSLDDGVFDTNVYGEMYVTGGKDQIGSLTLFHYLRKKMKKHERDTLIYIHGYATNYIDSVRRAFALKQLLAPINIVLFTWPSLGSKALFTAYKDDRHTARVSGPAMARGLLKVRDFMCQLTADTHCGRKLHLLAHSMGNYVLRNAVQEMQQQLAGRSPRLFDQVILMAADEDDDALELDTKLMPITRVCRRVTVYFNDNDRALDVSDWTKGNPQRLGETGPSHPFKVPRNVTSVDCSRVAKGLVEHNYYKDNPMVVQDMMRVLNGYSSDEIVDRTFIRDTNSYRINHAQTDIDIPTRFGDPDVMRSVTIKSEPEDWIVR